MVTQIFAKIVELIWNVLNISFPIDGINLKLWNVGIFVIALGLVINRFFPKGEKG